MMYAILKNNLLTRNTPTVSYKTMMPVYRKIMSMIHLFIICIQDLARECSIKIILIKKKS